MNKEQFITELVYDYEKQKIFFDLDEAVELVEQIWLDYLYQACPSYAMCIDPKIIDETRKWTPLCDLIPKTTYPIIKELTFSQRIIKYFKDIVKRFTE